MIVFKVTVRQTTVDGGYDKIPKDITFSEYHSKMVNAVKLVRRFENWQDDAGRMVTKITIETIHVREDGMV